MCICVYTYIIKYLYHIILNVSLPPLIFSKYVHELCGPSILQVSNGNSFLPMKSKYFYTIIVWVRYWIRLYHQILNLDRVWWRGIQDDCKWDFLIPMKLCLYEMSDLLSWACNIWDGIIMQRATWHIFPESFRLSM